MYVPGHSSVLINLYVLNTDNIFFVQDVSTLAIYHMKSFWQTHLGCHIINCLFPLAKNNDDIPNLNVT